MIFGENAKDNNITNLYATIQIRERENKKRDDSLNGKYVNLKFKNVGCRVRTLP